MAYKANGTALPIVAVNEGEVFTEGGVRRAGLTVALGSMPTVKQQNALVSGEITVLDEGGAAAHAFTGYTEALGCTVTLVRPDTAAEQVSGLARLAASLVTDEQAMASARLWPQWVAGQAYGAGEILRHGAALYRVAQAHTGQAHQPPDGEGMLAVYRLIREAEGQVLPWVSGEAVAVGDLRSHEGVVYEAYAEAGANVHAPDVAISVWKAVTA